jgi:hypothetical protein
MTDGAFLIDDVGAQLKTELTEHADRYEHALITTYTVSPTRLAWFEDLNAAVCAPEAALSTIRRADSVDDTAFTLHEEDIHGKWVLLWSDTEISCWTGSFNLTYSGLSNNVEWGGRFDGAVTDPFDLADVQAATVPDSPTNNALIDQLLDVVQSIIGGAKPNYADDHFRRHSSDPVVVHSGTGNTLRRSIPRILENARGPVEITYFTPTLNKTGVETLTDLVPAHIAPDDLDVSVYGARPKAAIDPTEPTVGTFVTSDHVADLKHRLGDFTLWTRINGEAGNTLPSGSQIRSGLAHLKALLITYTDTTGDDHHDVILTSANLTDNAWKATGGNIEFGIWLRDPDRTEAVRKFFTETLADCYAHADSQTLQDIDDRLAAGTDFEAYAQRSLTDLFTISPHEAGDVLTLTPPTDELPLAVTDCTWILRDIVTGEIDRLDGTIDPTTDGWQCVIPKSATTSNNCLASLEVTVETPIETPAYELSPAQRKRVATGEFALDEWDHIVVDDTVYPTGESLPAGALESAGTVWVYREYGTTLPQTLRLTPDRLDTAGISDPFLPAELITGVEPTTITLDTDETLPAVAVEFPEAVTPPVDSLTFTATEDQIGPIGWTDTAAGRQYIFDPAHAPATITLEPDTPFADHYPDTAVDCTLPAVETDDATPSVTTALKQITPEYTLGNATIPDLPDHHQAIDQFIHEDTALEVTLTDIPATFAAADQAYLHRRTGYFYHAPTQHSCTDPFTPPAPYATVQLHGLLGLPTDDSDTRAWFLTDTMAFTARKRLVESLRLDPDIPTTAPITGSDALSPLGWLGLDLAALALEDVGEQLLDHLTVSFWRDGTELPVSTPIRALQSGPQYYAIPLLPSLRDSPATYHIVVRASSDQSKYAWAATETELTLTHESGSKYRLNIDGMTQYPLEDNPAEGGHMLRLGRLLHTRLSTEARYVSALPKLDRKPTSLSLQQETVLRLDQRDS